MSTPVAKITFPKYTGLRCLMMPYIQGDPKSVPVEYSAYDAILSSVFIKRGDIGYLTIDESPVKRGTPHRGARAKSDRALHTEAGRVLGMEVSCGGWGSAGGWGSPSSSRTPDRIVYPGGYRVLLGGGVRILLANSIDDSCAVWDATHTDTSPDGDIGHCAEMYPYSAATLMKAGDVHEIGIFTPHESLPIKQDCHRQFLRIVGSPVYGREDYFTINPLMREVHR